MMRDVSLRVGVSESPLPGVSYIPRFSRHSKCLSKKAILSSVQNFVIAIGKPTARVQAFRCLAEMAFRGQDLSELESRIEQLERGGANAA
jgi:hypothetical protein